MNFGSSRSSQVLAELIKKEKKIEERKGKWLSGGQANICQSIAPGLSRLLCALKR
jgi:hypothetical protein